MSTYDRKKGSFLMLMASLFFSTMSAIGHLLENIPAMEKTFFRNVLSVFLVLWIIRKENIPLRLAPGTLPSHLMRSLFGTLGVVGGFYAMDHMVLSDATILMELSPFFIILFSALYGLLLFGQLSDGISYLGYGVILLAAVLSFLHKRKEGTEPSQKG